ncbi:CAS1 domain-containing protein [Rutstroemia sp. NJR-2017a BVV2]|nr:CAS1 domain-containing protein [Rutstroemia sp. NJR-2017a BVV2]
MPRLRLTIPAAPNRALSAVERVLQLLLCLVIASVVYRYCWLDISDPYKCGALLNKGQWLDAGPRWSSRKPFQNWQPPGCILHEYKRKDIQECFKNRRVVFVGDSTTRQIFWAVAKKMDQERAEEEMTELLDLDQKHKDLEFSSGGVTVQFVWDPWLNSTGLDKELKNFNANPRPGAKTDESASLLLLGAPGLWYARHGQENYFKEFRESIEHVIPFMDHARGDSPILPGARPFPSTNKSPNFLLLAPVQVPWYQALSPSREETITPEKIDLMNDYLQQVSAHSDADIVWSFSLMTWAGRGEYEESGLHVVDNVAHRKADVLLNLRCNADAVERGYPYDRTCCNNYRQPNVIQWSIVLTGMLLLPAVVFVRRNHLLRIGRSLPQLEVLGALLTLTLAVCFCYYADRTQLFEKEQKQFRRSEFLIATLVVFIGGLVSIRPNSTSKGAQEVTARPVDQGFLSREQTDEWKGWMQFIILIYHYTHGSKALWLFELLRNLVAAYLFMTGFGHTMYFLKREDYSLRRVASVLIRLNLLTCALTYMMRTDYMCYYFTPLVSFWFLVVYFTLRVRQDSNSKLGFLLLKVLLSSLFTTVIIKVPGMLESLRFILRYSYGVSWEVTNWRYRFQTDMLIVYIGMLVAIFYLRISQIRSSSIICTSPLDRLLSLIALHPTPFTTIATTASLILLPGFRILTQRSPDRDDYLWWHPYISFIPILCYLTLRNCHPLLRSHHSALFVALGKCSLETFVLQYHIWLAADTKGILRLGLWGRWTEAAVLTGLFLWISWRVADATGVVTGWVIGGGGVCSPGKGEDGKRKGKGGELPMLELDKGMLGRAEVGGEGKGRSWVDRVVVGLREDLRWRLGVMALGIWVGNMVYR